MQNPAQTPNHYTNPMAPVPMQLQPYDVQVLGSEYSTGIIAENTSTGITQEAIAEVTIGGKNFVLSRVEQDGQAAGIALVLPANENGRRATLVGVASAGQGLRIGRAHQSELFGGDLYVSRNHLEIHINEQNEPVLKDLGSTNGTEVRGIGYSDPKFNNNLFSGVFL